jgi:CRP-like cAMP-binding protein
MTSGLRNDSGNLSGSSIMRRTSYGERFAQDAAPGGAAPQDGRTAESDGAPKAEASGSMKRLLANRILGALPDQDFERMLPGLEPVSLNAFKSVDDTLEETRYVYFPEDAVVSHLTVFSDGNAVEVALTGREGMVGFGKTFGTRPPSHWSRVTVPGTALRMRLELFSGEFCGGGPFRRLLLEHAGRHMAQISQRSACANRHRLAQRLAAWLLMVHDRAGSDLLTLTQELIAGRLGARRAGVTQLAVDLQQRGLIKYSRGRVRILDRRGLEQAACECYGALRGD